MTAVIQADILHFPGKAATLLQDLQDSDRDRDLREELSIALAWKMEKEHWSHDSEGKRKLLMTNQVTCRFEGSRGLGVCR